MGYRFAARARPSTKRRAAALQPPGRDVLGALGGDELLEPRDVGFGHAAVVLDQRATVVVGAPATGAERLRDRCESVLQRLAAPFQEADPRLRRQVPEERETHPEPRVLALGVVRRFLKKLEEDLLPLRRDPVDLLAPRATLVTRFGLDRAVVLQAAKGRVERAVGDAPEAAQ